MSESGVEVLKLGADWRVHGQRSGLRFRVSPRGLSVTVLHRNGDGEEARWSYLGHSEGRPLSVQRIEDLQLTGNGAHGRLQVMGQAHDDIPEYREGFCLDLEPGMSDAIFELATAALSFLEIARELDKDLQPPEWAASWVTSAAYYTLLDAFSPQTAVELTFPKDYSTRVNDSADDIRQLAARTIDSLTRRSLAVAI